MDELLCVATCVLPYDTKKLVEIGRDIEFYRAFHGEGGVSSREFRAQTPCEFPTTERLKTTTLYW